jgi:hypothetical protein
LVLKTTFIFVTSVALASVRGQCAAFPRGAFIDAPRAGGTIARFAKRKIGEPMNRRQSLLALSTVSAHALFPDVVARFGRALAAPPEAAAWRPEVLSVEQGELLADLVETIIPATDTPGARAARVHVFVDLVLKHCRTASEREAFVKGLDAVASELRTRHGSEVAAVPGGSREELLQRLDASGDPFVRTLKELTVLGYCTSEVGATQGLAYVAVPGDYQGCVDLKPGQKGWATR